MLLFVRKLFSLSHLLFSVANVLFLGGISQPWNSPFWCMKRCAFVAFTWRCCTSPCLSRCPCMYVDTAAIQAVRSVVIDGFLSLINSCGNRIVKAPLLMYRNRKPGRLNNLTLSFQLSREWNEDILSHCLVLGMVVSFSLVSVIQLAGVYTSILGGFLALFGKDLI